MGSKVTHKAQCPRCASKGEDNNKDNLGIFDDGHTYCFKCQYYTPPTSANGKYGQPPGGVNRKTYDDSWREKYIGDYHHLTDRHIRAETLERYKVKVEIDDSGKDIKHHYPYFNQDGQMCGIKTRIVEGKRFFGSGNTRQVVLHSQYVKVSWMLCPPMKCLVTDITLCQSTMVLIVLTTSRLT